MRWWTRMRICISIKERDFYCWSAVELMEQLKILTQKDLHSAFAHVVVTVKCLSIECTHFLAHESWIVIEQFDETLENVQVEGRGDQFSMCPPFLTYGNFLRKFIIFFKWIFFITFADNVSFLARITWLLYGIFN